MSEEWRDIKGFEGIYQASNKGRIKHLYTDTFSHGRHYIIEERIEEPFVWQSRYLRVDLVNKSKKNRRSAYVHTIIAETFIGPRPEGYVIDHIDGNYLNNAADNLRYTTVSGNINNPITKEKLIKSIRNYWDNISDEEKENNSKAIQLGMRKNNGIQKISKANKGRIPVYKANDYKRIKEEDLDLYINNGYTIGLPEHVINKCKQNTNHPSLYGEQNPAFGRRWMNNGIERIYVKETEIDSYLSKGYHFGMN